MPLTLLKLILSQIYLKNSAKINILRFRECLKNAPLRSVLLVMQVMKNNKLQNLFPSKKCGVKKLVA